MDWFDKPLLSRLKSTRMNRGVLNTVGLALLKLFPNSIFFYNEECLFHVHKHKNYHSLETNNYNYVNNFPHCLEQSACTVHLWNVYLTRNINLHHVFFKFQKSNRGFISSRQIINVCFFSHVRVRPLGFPIFCVRQHFTFVWYCLNVIFVNVRGLK